MTLGYIEDGNQMACVKTATCHPAWASWGAGMRLAALAEVAPLMSASRTHRGGATCLCPLLASFPPHMVLVVPQLARGKTDRACGCAAVPETCPRGAGQGWPHVGRVPPCTWGSGLAHSLAGRAGGRLLGFLRVGRTGLLVSSVCKPVACWAAQVPPSVETLDAHFCFHLLLRMCFGKCTRANLSLGSVKAAFPSMDKAAWWLLHPGC